MQLRRLYIAVVVCIVATLSGVSLDALDRQALGDVVDFSMTLEQIHHILEEEGAAALPSDRAVVLDGVVAEILLIDPEPETFLAQIDLVSGRWIGLQDIRLYRAYVFVEGPQFAERLSAAPAARGAAADAITTNSRVIVLGTIIDVYIEQDGSSAPIIDGFELRPVN